jgi:hypothetical protein
VIEINLIRHAFIIGGRAQVRKSPGKYALYGIVGRNGAWVLSAAAIGFCGGLK